MTALLVTGTGPGVGVSTVTAAVAALAVDRGTTCRVVVPAATGVPDGAPPARTPAGPVLELARYPDALSPAAAARVSGRPAVDPASVLTAVLAAQRDHDLVLVDGSGGLLVRYDDDGFTVAELARSLRLPVVLVASAGPGGVNAAALTLEALAHRGLELAGVVLGSWDRSAGPLERSAVPDLEMLAARPLLGALPAGAVGDRLLTAARAGLGPALGGTFVAADFRRTAAL